MLDFKESNRRSARNEAAVAEQFRKLNYLVKRLDSKSSKRRRPDFLISTSSARPQMLCEVKTVDSAFYPRDKSRYGIEHVHISTLDDKFRGPFKNIPIDLSKIDKGLADAIDKRKALVEDDSSFAVVPLLVALFFDPFAAEYLFAYPLSFAERDESFREVSGILTIKEGFARNEALKKLSLEQRRRRLKADLERASSTDTDADVMNDLPPHSKDFVLFRNEAASRAVPEDFARQCLPPESYYQ
jgi:hypothetical protein